MSIRRTRVIVSTAVIAIIAGATVVAVADGARLSSVASAGGFTVVNPGEPSTTTQSRLSDATGNSGTAGVGMGGMPGMSGSGSTPTTSTSSAAATEASAAPTVTSSGTEKVWVSVLSATPQTSDDVNTGLTQSAVQTLINEMNSYWSAQSDGKVTIQLGGFETRSLGESSCDPNAALSAEETSAFGGMFANSAWKGTHEHLLVLSAESCNSESFATVGGVGGEIFSGNGLDATTGEEYLLHEFGHNLGFEHADASICANTSSYDGRTSDFTFTSTVCPTREYDDYFDIMGYTVKNATPNLSSPQRILAGWMTNFATITSATPSATTTLTALGGSGGTQALKIIDPVSGDTYYVEYRTDTGLDATSAEFNYGLQCDPAMSGYTLCELDSNASTGDVRILRVIPFASANANGTTVMATELTAGSTDQTKRHTHLNSGDGFVSVDGGFSLRVVSMNPSSGASISVTFGTPSPAPTATPTPVFTTTPTTMQLTTAPARLGLRSRRVR
jgi:hypothetical protein